MQLKQRMKKLTKPTLLKIEQSKSSENKAKRTQENQTNMKKEHVIWLYDFSFWTHGQNRTCDDYVTITFKRQVCYEPRYQVAPRSEQYTLSFRSIH